jgi:hypothetical protein
MKDCIEDLLVEASFQVADPGGCWRDRQRCDEIAFARLEVGLSWVE